VRVNICATNFANPVGVDDHIDPLPPESATTILIICIYVAYPIRHMVIPTKSQEYGSNHTNFACMRACEREK